MTGTRRGEAVPKMDDERADLVKGLGRSLGRHMEALGISVSELAERTEVVPKDRIERILTGEVEPGAIEAMWFAGALGIFTDELFEGSAETWDTAGGDGALPESEYELPLLKAYDGGRREGARPVEDSVGEWLGSRLTDADHAAHPDGGERWSARLRSRRLHVLDAGLVGFDPHLRVWELTDRGEERLRLLELRSMRNRPGARWRRGRERDQHDGRSDVR